MYALWLVIFMDGAQWDSAEQLETLERESEGSAENRLEDLLVHEYWGADWRVHVEVPL